MNRPGFAGGKSGASRLPERVRPAAGIPGQVVDEQHGRVAVLRIERIPRHDGVADGAFAARCDETRTGGCDGQAGAGVHHRVAVVVDIGAGNRGRAADDDVVGAAGTAAARAFRQEQVVVVGAVEDVLDDE